MDNCKEHHKCIEKLKSVEIKIEDMSDDIYGRTGNDISIFERFRLIDTRFDTLETLIKNITNKPKQIIIWADRLFKLFITGSILAGIILKWMGKF